MPFHPYLNFAGTCRQAFTRYQEILGGELSLMAMSDLPADEESPTDQLDLIAHAALVLDDGSLLMASDDPGGTDDPQARMYVNFSLTDTGEAKRVFDALAEGGEVQMPIGETFWSPMFGICTDRFGTPWMVNVEGPEPS